MSRPFSDPAILNFSQVLSSLSYALDLTSGHSMAHAQRSCLIGMRIGRQIGLPEQSLTDLYFAILLKDSGCSSNAARMFEIFGGDEIESKRLSRVTDWDNLAEVVQYVAAVTLPKGSFLSRAKKMVKLSFTGAETTVALSDARCNRGAQIALTLGMGQQSAACIASLEERWDGGGSPQHLTRQDIPLLSRIASLAQTLDVFWRTFDLDTAYEIGFKRSGRWFDPDVVNAAAAFRSDTQFWERVSSDPATALEDLECDASVQHATDNRIDDVCNAFANIVDAKSPFTGAHSFRVCQYSMEMASCLDLDPVRLTTLRRASLLHDVGKLGVPNSILDKPGKLDDEEWSVVKKHPFYTYEILRRIDGFERLAEIAGAHHERLDGRGYFRGLRADQLDLEMRIVAVADVFDALSAKRPYRDAMPVERVFEILDEDVDVALDRTCVESLKSKYARCETLSIQSGKAA